MILKTTDYEKMVEAILNEPKWTIVGHAIPDGDCVGAITAMILALEDQNLEVRAILEDGVPHMYRFLKGTDKIKSHQDAAELFDSVIYVDCAGPDRVGESLKEKLANSRLVLNIDHHISNNHFGDLALVDPAASSTCELLYNLINAMGVHINADIGTPLYCGMVMDTGSFQYTATKPLTMRIAADLLESGVDLDLVRSKLYESKSRIEVAVLEKALSSLTFNNDGSISWMKLTYEDMLHIGAVNQHFEGTINVARSIDGVEVAVLFREIEPGMIKIGLRSRGLVDVNKVASTWGGGGHRLAAGARLDGSMESVINQVVARVAEEL
ncbi:MAG: DHH family phosphoesterase [Ignavibacteriales bacterium]